MQLRAHLGSARVLFACLSVLAIARVAHAQPIDLRGHWFDAKASSRLAAERPLDERALRAVDGLDRTGGRFVYRASFRVPHAGRYVLDFKNSSTIGRFHHLVYDARGQLIAERAGGIQSTVDNPFFLRHGRELSLQKGDHHLVSELESPFFLGQPAPFLAPLEAYRQAIKPGNALTLLGLGVFLGLGVYYAALAFARRRVADTMYALFILGNLLYNGSALLLLPDLFGMHWFYLISVPILFSNIAYVLFVMALLEIRRGSQPRLYRAGMGLLGLLTGFAALGLVLPSWSLELDRYGVALFGTYGLVAAVVRTRQGDSSARFYLAAVLAFFVLGGGAISLARVHAHTVYIEHLGLLAVVVEVALLALVLAHQFSRLHDEKDSALLRADESERKAYSDALTGLPNRHQLEAELAKLPLEGSLTFIDLDGLKYYNDKYGHRRGDQLLCGFANHLEERLDDGISLYRLSGDEFAITSRSGDLAVVAEHLAQTFAALLEDGFEFAGGSYGSVHVHENPARDHLKHIADTRMYEQKRQRRKSLPDERIRRHG